MPNGRYRVLVSRFAEGAPLGNFRYYGTRPDDPNDIIPHEDRRELRAARVFGAWLNHDDSRGVNSLDMLQTDGARRYVKHYMFDFGSIMGSGTVFAQRHRAGNEYIVDWAPGWLTLATLGLYTRDWLHIDYPDVPPSVGRFEGHSFDPLKWRPEYPNTAFDNMRADDAFWAARIVRKVQRRRHPRDRLEGSILRSARDRVHHGDAHRTAEQGAEDVADRRESVGGLCAGTPTGSSRSPTLRLRQTWRLLPKNIGYGGRGSTTRPVQRRRQSKPPRPGRACPLRRRCVADAEFVQVEIASHHPQFSAWKAPVTVHFRRNSAGWVLVGVTRGQ